MSLVMRGALTLSFACSVVFWINYYYHRKHSAWWFRVVAPFARGYVGQHKEVLTRLVRCTSAEEAAAEVAREKWISHQCDMALELMAEVSGNAASPWDFIIPTNTFHHLEWCKQYFATKATFMQEADREEQREQQREQHDGAASDTGV